VGEFLPTGEMLWGDAAAVGERMDHRGSLLWGRYEMDCCRFVAGRFWGHGVVGDEETTSELEEVLDNESRLEVVRCNGRGGNECRLAGVVIFSEPPVESMLILMCSVGNHAKFGVWTTRNQDVLKFGKLARGTVSPPLSSGIG